MASPFVRRRRLAVELAALRDAAGLTHAQLAAEIGQSRMKISRLENGHIRPNQAEVLKILEVLGVEGEQWSRLVEVAKDAADRGWWTSFGEDMGARQAVYADLEAGAVTIREFQPTVPGLLQTREFAAYRRAAAVETWPATDRAQRSVEGRITRQKMVRRPGGPLYEVVLDEVAVRRLPAPPEVVATQARRMVELAADPRITVRVLAVDARIDGYEIARSPFSLYTYADPLDPQVVAVDTVTADVVLTSLTEPEQVQRYTALYERLSAAAMSPQDSVAFLQGCAEQLGTENGDPR